MTEVPAKEISRRRTACRVASAVDFACNVNISKANQIAAQHGGAHNFENCANNAHWHFDF